VVLLAVVLPAGGQDLNQMKWDNFMDLADGHSSAAWRQAIADDVKTHTDVLDLENPPIAWERGALIYGDYKDIGAVSSALACAQACNADPACFRWNFQALQSFRCEFKGSGGYRSEDHLDWITGLRTTYTTPGQSVVTNTVASSVPLLKFEWTTPYDGADPIYNYEGELHDIAAGTFQSRVFPGTPLASWTETYVVFSGVGDYGLQQQKQFKFRVRAINGQGSGTWSDWSSETDVPRGWPLDDPAAPANLARHVDTPAKGHIKVQWDALTSLQTGGDLAGTCCVLYDLWGGPAGTVVQLTMVDSTLTFHEVTVPAGQSWEFKVRSTNRAGKTSPFSGTVTLISAAVPASPESLALTSTTAQEVVMVWDAPADDGGAPIQGYEVSSDNFATFQTVGPTVLTYTFTGQTSAATVQYYVRATNELGASAASSGSVTVA